MTETFFELSRKIFSIQNKHSFQDVAIKVFNYQYQNNDVYRHYCQLLNQNPSEIVSIKQIPFLPISVFKTHQVQTESFSAEVIFSSSGTTGKQTSRHFVKHLSLYRQSFMQAFQLQYGIPKNYIILGLLPSYLERDGSSLVYMVNALIEASEDDRSGFYLNNLDDLANLLKGYNGTKKIILIGVSYALLDLAENYDLDLSDHIVMETGGMKGKRAEMTKEALHTVLKKAFNVQHIHSEYGMTELLSQAYAKHDGLFTTPPWMQVLIREHNDPFAYTQKKSGGINVIDLANLSSCSFIATDDLGKTVGEAFQVLGRFDFADLRGCNLLVQ